MLVDYAILAREAGLNRFDALVDACHKRSRPIIMTTLAMGAGMMPLALGWGANPSFRSPMAIAVIGGLVTSTLLSLLVVPVVFTFIDDAEHWLGRTVRQLRGPKGSVVKRSVNGANFVYYGMFLKGVEGEREKTGRHQIYYQITTKFFMKKCKEASLID